MIIAIILFLLITLGVGLPLVLLILPKQNFVAIVGLSFPLGIGIFTFVMFLTNIFGIGFSLLNEFLILLILSTPLMALTGKRVKNFFVGFVDAFKKSKWSSVEKVMLAALVFLILTSFLNTFYWPVHIWDSVVLYDFRGHVFAQTGFMKAAFIDAYYYSYPLLTSLAHTIVYLAGGRYPQLIDSLFYLSLGLGFCGFLREFISRRMSLIFTLILLTVQPIFYHSLLSLTNLPFSVYLSLGAVCVYLWDKKREVGYLILSALLTGLSTWTRSSEPFWLGILLVVFIVSVYRRRLFNVLTYSLFFFPILEGWKVFQSYLARLDPPDAITAAGYSKILPGLFNIQNWWLIIGYLYEHVVKPWGAVFAVFILAILLLFLLRKVRKYFLVFFITFVLLGILVAGVFVFSVDLDYWYRIGDAIERLSILFYPLFVYCVALVIQEFVRIKK